jgi:hypothetical protein
MTILLLALLLWMLILVSAVGLCVAARDGDAQQALTASVPRRGACDAPGEWAHGVAVALPGPAATDIGSERARAA